MKPYQKTLGVAALAATLGALAAGAASASTTVNLAPGLIFHSANSCVVGYYGSVRDNCAVNAVIDIPLTTTGGPLTVTIRNQTANVTTAVGSQCAVQGTTGTAFGYYQSGTVTFTAPGQTLQIVNPYGVALYLHCTLTPNSLITAVSQTQ